MTLEINKKRLPFYLTFIVWFVVDFITQTTIVRATKIPFLKINTFIDVAVLFFLILQITGNKALSLRELMVISILLFIALVSAIMSDNFKILSLFLFIAAARDVDFTHFIRRIYYVILSLTIIVFILCISGVVEDVIMLRKGGFVRHSLGFSHPNVLGVVIFQIVVCYVILNEGMLVRQMFITGIAAVFDYLIPNSQTPTVLLGILFLLLPIFYLLQKKGTGLVLFYKMMLVGAVGCNIICIFITVFDFSKYSFLNYLNMMISTRFKYARLAYVESGYKLFGQVIYTAEEQRRMVGLQGNLYFDTAYSVLLIRYGLIIYLLFSVAYIAIMKRYVEKRKGLFVIVLFVFAVYGVMESSMFMLKYNFSLLLLSELIYSHSETKVSYRSSQYIDDKLVEKT